MLPLNARGRSARSSPASAAAVMIIPGVQNPHWKPWAARKSAAGDPGPSPSTVVTSLPRARIAG